mmetsp:Transcript_11917/g.18281  ORF Transcript_11917/g.18281 Transcript_11917/m.18281 type:complete len:253 (+) Transcript_11917:1078-1836(+)
MMSKEAIGSSLLLPRKCQLVVKVMLKPEQMDHAEKVTVGLTTIRQSFFSPTISRMNYFQATASHPIVVEHRVPISSPTTSIYLLYLVDSPHLLANLFATVPNSTPSTPQSVTLQLFELIFSLSPIGSRCFRHPHPRPSIRQLLDKLSLQYQCLDAPRLPTMASGIPLQESLTELPVELQNPHMILIVGAALIRIPCTLRDSQNAQLVPMHSFRPISAIEHARHEFHDPIILPAFDSFVLLVPITLDQSCEQE